MKNKTAPIKATAERLGIAEIRIHELMLLRQIARYIFKGMVFVDPSELEAYLHDNPEVYKTWKNARKKAREWQKENQAA